VVVEVVVGPGFVVDCFSVATVDAVVVALEPFLKQLQKN